MKRPGAVTAFFLLSLVCALQLLALLRTSDAWLPARIDVTLRAGESVVLGRQELGAPRAAQRQMLLRRDSGGAWHMRNLAPAQPLVLRSGEARERSSDMPLSRGQVIHAGAARLAVSAAGDGRVTLLDGAARLDYDGAALLRDGALQANCPDTPLSARLVALFNRWAPHAWTLARPLAIGGSLKCGNRIPAAAIEPGHAALVRLGDGRIALAARGAQPVLVSSGA